MSEQHPLDNPARASLLGPHAHLAERRGRVLRYPADVSPWVGLPDEPDDGTWRDVAELLGPGGLVPLAAVRAAPPSSWETVMDIPGVQMIDVGVPPATAESAGDAVVALGPSDVPEMVALVERTRPGPFRPRTIELGTYLGVRRAGALVAMAGERLHPPGWTEISAVCTDAAHRGQGLGTRLVRALAAGIRSRGETPFLHAAAGNTAAIRLYGELGFRLRRHVSFRAFRVPVDARFP